MEGEDHLSPLIGASLKQLWIDIATDTDLFLGNVAWSKNVQMCGRQQTPLAASNLEDGLYSFTVLN